MSTWPIVITGKESGVGADLDFQTYLPTGDLAPHLAASGVDPHSLNKMSWPVVGMSRWSTCRVLMTRADLITLGTSLTSGGISGGALQFCRVKFGAVEFPQMTIGLTLPTLLTIEGQAMCVVEFHDRRWLWRHYRVKPSSGLADPDIAQGFNLAGFHRGRLQRNSLDTGVPWTPQDIVEFVRASVSPYDGVYVAANDTWTDADASSSYTSDDAVWEVNGDDTVPGLIDKVLAKSGNVMTVVPAMDGSTVDEGLAFDIRDIADEARAATFYSDYTDSILAGGLEFLSAAATPPASGAASWANVNSNIVRRDCPLTVRVEFPFAVADGTDDILSECSRDNCTGAANNIRPSLAHTKTAGKLSWDSSSGRPTFSGSLTASPASYCVFDDMTMLTSRDDTTADLLDTTRLSARATQVASIFYARYMAGNGDAFFRGFIQPETDIVWTGSQWWELSLLPHPVHGDGNPIPITRIWGERHCDLFGYHPIDEPQSVQGFGTVTAFRGPDGSTKVIGQQIGGIPCKIKVTAATAIGGASFQWEYTAELLQWDGTNWISTEEEVTCYNAMERNNTATFVAPSTLWPLDIAGTFNVLPFGEDRDATFHPCEVPAVIYECLSATGGKRIEFCQPNVIDGVCAV